MKAFAFQVFGQENKDSFANVAMVNLSHRMAFHRCSAYNLTGKPVEHINMGQIYRAGKFCLSRKVHSLFRYHVEADTLSRRANPDFECMPSTCRVSKNRNWNLSVPSVPNRTMYEYR